MTTPASEVVTQLEQMSPEARLELWRWLEPFVKQKIKASGWQFDVDNEGGWGLVVFNNTSEIDTVGDASAAFIDTVGGGIYLISRDGTTPNGSLKVTPTSVALTCNVGVSACAIGLSNTGCFIEVAGHTLFQIDPDGTIHIKTGASIVADL